MFNLRSIDQKKITYIISSLFIGLCFVMAASVSVFAQTGRPVSGVIAATDKPIQISYTNEAGETIGRIAGVGEPIYLNDEITTPKGASLQVLLRDQTVFSIGPNSTLVFDEFIFDPTASDEVALTASVKKGTFKFISGKISKIKPGAMTLKLPNATASVRGTSVVGRVDETGASDIVLLTGAVQLQTTTSLTPVDLIQPGWGVSVETTGEAGAPELFSEADINEIIQEVEFTEEAGEAEGAGAEGAGEQTATAEDEAAAAEEEAAIEEEAVETIVAAVEEAGEEVSVEEVAAIIQEAEGNPEAVAEAIVKVIVENQIERGDIGAETLIALEAFDGETFNIEELNVEDIKIEDLGIESFDFEEGASFVEVFSERLDSEGLVLPSFGEEVFFEPVVFENALFDEAQFANADISLTRQFDIKEVSNLIVGDPFDGGDAPELELTFFDILFNAETINEEFKAREVFFGFEEGGDPFAQDESADEGAGTEDTQRSLAFEQRDPALGDETEQAPVTFAQTETDAPSFGEDGAGSGEFEAPKLELTRFEVTRLESATEKFETSFVLDRLAEPEFKDEAPIFYDEPQFDEKADAELARASFLEFIEQVEQARQSEEGIDVLAYYKNGQAQSTWLRLQADGTLGNNDTFDGLISSAYEGSAVFADTVQVVDELTTFSAKASYAVTLNYDTSAITGTFVLGNMSLNGDTYYASNGTTSITTNLAQTIDTTSNKQVVTNSAGAITGGNDENANGVLNIGETVEEVRLTSVDFHNAVNAPDITGRVRTHLDMSAGSAVVLDSVLDGTLAEMTISSEHYNCTPTCTKTGMVGLAVSKVAAEE